MGADESNGMCRRVRVAARLFLLRCSLESYHSQVCRVGVGSPKSHAHISEGGSTIEVWRLSSVYWVIAQFSCCLSDRAGGTIRLATAKIDFRRHRRGSLCYGL